MAIALKRAMTKRYSCEHPPREAQNKETAFRPHHPRSSVLGLLSPQLVADRRWQLSPEAAKSAILNPRRSSILGRICGK